MQFLMMKKGIPFTQKLVTEVKAAIRKELSARHVPKFVFETPEIPVCVAFIARCVLLCSANSLQTTVNLKKIELPVKQIVAGKIIKPSGTLANPQCLDYYYRFAKVEEMVESKSKL